MCECARVHVCASTEDLSIFLSTFTIIFFVQGLHKGFSAPSQLLGAGTNIIFETNDLAGQPTFSRNISLRIQSFESCLVLCRFAALPNLWEAHGAVQICLWPPPPSGVKNHVFHWATGGRVLRICVGPCLGPSPRSWSDPWPLRQGTPWASQALLFCVQPNAIRLQTLVWGCVPASEQP